MKTRAIAASLMMFWTAYLGAGIWGGSWMIVNSESTQEQVEMSLEMVNRMRANLEQNSTFQTESNSQWKTLTTFRTLDGREGFVVQSPDGVVHTLTHTLDADGNPL